ncbi:hypothetical protein DDZ15_14015 [Rhodohalobacter mucosus]|uniref:Uncharacterized protein n=2 Tax=Rhodohalobacter mucosus TaxID=2079485 RepID=A0A316TM83_9BACT|nr:hypothetical protein DDZ15_14015 [Rhodohalobacter mucosus]
MSVATLAIATALLLLIPLVAMQFTSEVVWSASDFIVAGVLLFGTGLAYLLITKKDQRLIYRSASAVALGSALFLVWSNLAVGIIGSENNSINLLYFVVIAIGITGASTSRFQPLKLAFTLYAMAGSQLLITVIALLTGMQDLPGSSISEIVAVNGLFIMLFIISALLFGKAARDQKPDQANMSQNP